MQYRTTVWRGGVLALTAVAGCGAALPPIAEVEGVVRLDGKPLAGVYVEFAPEVAGGAATRLPFSDATTDANGHYELRCETQVPGALVGMHKVIILRPRHRPGPNDPAPPPPGPPIPMVYQSLLDTPLHVEVKSDQHVYDLDLKTPPS
jgi:hypothetical protein